MNISDAKKLIAEQGLQVTDESRTKDNYATTLRCSGGQIVNVYDSGKTVVQGKNADSLRDAFQDINPGSLATPVGRKVFVVYGHDQKSRDELEILLHRWKLEPVILDQLPSKGATLIEKLEHYLSDNAIKYGIVMATPDDEGYAVGKADEKRCRARQNVVLELGLLLARLGRSNVAILLKNQKEMERPSDIDGLVYIPFEDAVEDAKVQLAKELSAQGITIDMNNL